MKKTMRAVFAFMPMLLLLPVVPQVWAKSAPQSSPPPLPSSFYGSLQADSAASSPPGLVVSAYINETQYATTTIIAHEGQWVYSLKVPADNPATEEIEGGRPGDMVSFLVDGRLVATAPWQSGSNTQVDLTIEPTTMAQIERTPSDGRWFLMMVGLVFLLIVITVFWWRRRRAPALYSETA